MGMDVDVKFHIHGEHGYTRTEKGDVSQNVSTCSVGNTTVLYHRHRISVLQTHMSVLAGGPASGTDHYISLTAEVEYVTTSTQRHCYVTWNMCHVCVQDLVQITELEN